MSTNLVRDVDIYFNSETSKVYVEILGRIETFQKYISNRKRIDCFYTSVYALMGLKPEDFLVRGYIHVDGEEEYYHGWVEFMFEGNEYVFDSSVIGVTPKKVWYKKFNPRIEYKKTQSEILDEFLNERNAFEIQKEFWQFKGLVMSTYKENPNAYEVVFDNENNGLIPSALVLARLVRNINNLKIIRFIAYDESHD